MLQAVESGGILPGRKSFTPNLNTDDDDVEKDSLIFACLDGKLWEEVIPVKNQRPNVTPEEDNS
jgi:hypothetical protein